MLLCQRLKAHGSALTAAVVVNDSGKSPSLLSRSAYALCSASCVSTHADASCLTGLRRACAAACKEVVTSSLDKSVALWRLQVNPATSSGWISLR